MGHEFNIWFKKKMISHKVTTAYSPKSNGYAEWFKRSLMDMSKTMLTQLETPREDLWDEAILTACYIRNRLLTESSKEKCTCLLYTSPSPRDQRGSRMPSSA